MNWESDYKITSWSWDSEEKWLKLNISESTMGMSGTWFRTQEKDPVSKKWVWVWRQWSMAGKPTVQVPQDIVDCLNTLVLYHSELENICKMWDIGV